MSSKDLASRGELGPTGEFVVGMLILTLLEFILENSSSSIRPELEVGEPQKTLTAKSSLSPRYRSSMPLVQKLGWRLHHGRRRMGVYRNTRRSRRNAIEQGARDTVECRHHHTYEYLLVKCQFWVERLLTVVIQRRIGNPFVLCSHNLTERVFE